MNLEVGTQLGEYRILSRIGRGAYGVVFEAEHSITRRIDAVKLMLDAGASSTDEEQRFLREIQAQASLQHPNIATVYGAFRTPWGLALAMELVRGKSLRNVLQGAPLPPAAAAAYILPVLEGLSRAESLGIVHRDIKPDNILITADGTVKLTDFGLAQVANSARITTSGENLGTPCYMSPEQVIGSEPADARTDVYSTGVVLYEAVTGRPPFMGSNGFAVMMAHQSTLPVPPIELQPSVGAELNRVILKALEKLPDRRFQNAAEFRAALEQAVMPAAVAAPSSAPRRARRAPLVAAAAAVTLAICGFGAWAGHFTAHRGDSESLPPIVKPQPPALQPPAPQSPVALPPQPPPEATTATAPDPQPEAVPSPAPAHPRRVHRSAKSLPKKPALALTPTTVHGTQPDPVPERHPAPAPETGLAPSLPSRPVAAELPPASAPPPAESEPEPVPPKRRNIFRRALGRILGHRVNPPAAQSASPKSDSGIKP
jgi:serine/threonine protein kinase